MIDRTTCPTGAVRIDPIVQAPDPSRATAAYVTFEAARVRPGIRIRWVKPWS